MKACSVLLQLTLALALALALTLTLTLTRTRTRTLTLTLALSAACSPLLQLHLGVNMPLVAARALAIRTHAGWEHGPAGCGVRSPWATHVCREMRRWGPSSHAATPMREQRGWSHRRAAACSLPG